MKKPLKFKVGDRVRIKIPVIGINHPATVTYIYKKKFLGMDYKIRIDGDEGESEAHEEDLTLLEEQK